MTEHWQALIIGAGPAGLACAAKLAEAGLRVLVLERKDCIGPKVCAGGVTCNGLLAHLPPELVEASFCHQIIRTPWQRITLSSAHPMVATINRQRLGQWMAEQAQTAGAILLTKTQALGLEGDRLLIEQADGARRWLNFEHLIGADGAHSLVRRSLNLPQAVLGLGVQAMLPKSFPRMEWHLDQALFGSGYAWIFPHAQESSLGAYCDGRQMQGRELKVALLRWAQQQGIELPMAAIRAGWVNAAYHGVSFPQRRWLIGDAAGLASGLTGEGIFPAIVSGKAVAALVLGARHPGPEMEALLRKQRQHRRVLDFALRHPRAAAILMELFCVLLRSGCIDFKLLEMASATAATASPGERSSARSL